MPQIGAGADHGRDGMNAFAARDENADVAIAQDVPDLLAFQQGVDRNEDGARHGGAERGGDGFDPLVEIKGDALGATDAECE